MRRPLFIARQSASPKGLLGKLIASIMVGETLEANERAIEALQVNPADHVLDIGCGSGLSLERLTRLATAGHVSGVDPSELMASRAAERNRNAIKARQVSVSVAAAEALPYVDEQFDKVMSVHTIYFWEDLGKAFREIARVAKTGGQLVLVFRTSEATAAIQSFPSEVYTFRPLHEVCGALAEAGFSVQKIDEEPAGKDPVLLVARRADRTA